MIQRRPRRKIREFCPGWPGLRDTDGDTLWLIVSGPEELEFLKDSQSLVDLSHYYPEDPKQLPPELAGITRPPETTPVP
jgi:hypothetical protein